MAFPVTASLTLFQDDVKLTSRHIISTDIPLFTQKQQRNHNNSRKTSTLGWETTGNWSIPSRKAITGEMCPWHDIKYFGSHWGSSNIAQATMIMIHRYSTTYRCVNRRDVGRNQARVWMWNMMFLAQLPCKAYANLWQQYLTLKYK